MAVLTRILAAFRDLLSSDAAGRRATVYAVAATQLGHVVIGFWFTKFGVAVGTGILTAALATVALWAAVWEGLQYLRDAPAGHRVRRRWDWAADALCYVSGASLAACMVAGGGWGARLAWTVWVVALCAVLGFIFGRPSRTRNQDHGR